MMRPEGAWRGRWIPVVLGAWLLAAPLAPRAVLAQPAPRTALSADDLATRHTPGPWPMSAFAPPDGGDAAATTRQVFQGRLRFVRERSERGFRALLDRYGDATANNRAAMHLPEFDAQLVQSGNALIPIRRGTIPGRPGDWELILEPGRVWDEPGDGEATRAALPFTLEERNANCMHQGVLTFLFRGDGTISDVAFEIAHETCAYFQFDWWGYAQATYTPQAIPEAGAVVARFHDEVRARLPVRPIDTLPQDFPGARAEDFASAHEIPPRTLTTHGLVVDGVVYAGDCPTRFGPYPFCEALDLPSYSLAKSIDGAIASMRLAALYPDVLTASVADYVPACAGPGGWQGVTIENTLDMATGRFLSADDQRDEDGADMLDFFTAETHAAKIAFACTHYPRRDPPGTRWVYHTTDSYVLGTALDAFYRAKLRADADGGVGAAAGTRAEVYRDLLVRDLWRPLDLSPALAVPRRTYDAVGQNWTGYGLTLHADDVAKLASFLQNAGGRIGTRQMLDPRVLDEALQRDPAHRGLRARSDDLRYNHGFWAWNAQRTLGCREPTWIPFMSGYGGIVVAMFPNGMTYYYFSDGGVFRWAIAAAAADRMRSFCSK
jgi:hypothetical protein